ncbi:MAG TPA: hypothetical protein VEZ20_03610 [Allosphingosinicella sp.]|nr:hypothetical protein [Allosphingosinicella sp.]
MQEHKQADDGLPGAAAPATTAEIVERMTTRVANSLVIAAGLLALGIYWSGDEVETQTYQAVATPDGRVIRVNTHSGSVVSCDATRCRSVWLHGDELDRVSEEVGERVREAIEGREPGPQGPGARPALPAPAGAPAAGQPPQQPQSAPAPALAPATPAQPQAAPQPER